MYLRVMINECKIRRCLLVMVHQHLQRSMSERGTTQVNCMLVCVLIGTIYHFYILSNPSIVQEHIICNTIPILITQSSKDVCMELM